MLMEEKCQVRRAEEAKSSSSEINTAAAPAAPPPNPTNTSNTHKTNIMSWRFFLTNPAFLIFLKQTRSAPAWP